MIELETAAIAALLLLTDMICSGIAAWRQNPKLSAVAGSATSGGALLVLGSMIMPLDAAVIIAVASAACLGWLKNAALRSRQGVCA